MIIRNVTTVRVRYADTDQMRTAYYGRYFEYFEQARSDLLRSIGLPYSDIEGHGILLPVIEASAKYRRPARYDDSLEIECVVSDVPVARIRIDYKVYLENDPEPIADGYTVHSFVNAATGRPTRAPAMIVQALEEASSERNESHAEERTA